MVAEDGLAQDQAELIRLALDGLMISTLLYDWSEDGAFYNRSQAILTTLVRQVVR